VLEEVVMKVDETRHQQAPVEIDGLIAGRRNRALHGLDAPIHDRDVGALEEPGSGPHPAGVSQDDSHQAVY
jgi:hypothetical protein